MSVHRAANQQMHITRLHCILSYLLLFTEGRDSAVGIAKRYGQGRYGDRFPVEARFSAPDQIGPGAHPASYTVGTGSFPVVKRPGRGVDQPSNLAPRLKKEYGYNYSPPMGL